MKKNAQIKKTNLWTKEVKRQLKKKKTREAQTWPWSQILCSWRVVVHEIHPRMTIRVCVCGWVAELGTFGFL